MRRAGFVIAIAAAAVLCASRPAVSAPVKQLSMQDLCLRLKAEIKEFGWNINPCDGIKWTEASTSVNGYPLVYAEFGDPKSSNTTLVLSMVHGDEITPLYIGFELIKWLEHNIASLKGARVVVAPLINPDSLFARPRTRVNARGVDCNRNFSTRDWHAKALKLWKTRFRSDKRRFPGNAPDSEPETIFQKGLIEKFQPQKILSIHAPLNFTDYDGPNNLALARFPREYVRECLKLRRHLRAISGGFFTGSLGNYAGQERGIPTITLELPTADPRKARGYWAKFRTGIRTMFEFKVPNYALLMKGNVRKGS